MPRRCPHCKLEIIGRPISKLPLYRETEPYEFLGKTYHSKFNWEALRWQNLRLKNLIIGNPLNLAIILSVLFMAWAYTHDSAAYREVYSNPCDYVKKNIDACLEFEKNETLRINPDLTISNINLSEYEGVS